MYKIDLLLSDNNKQQLIDEVKSIALVPVKDGSGQARGPNTNEGWIHGLSMARIQHWEFEYLPHLHNAIYELTGIRAIFQVMINRLEPNSTLDKHRDGNEKSKERPRFHLPIVTNDEVYWWDEKNGAMHFEPFAWHGPVPYMNTLHSMSNNGDTERIHVVVDLVEK